MSALFDNGHIIDLILALMIIEGVVLFLYHKCTGRGIPPCQLIGFLGSGVFLMLAVRAALVDAYWVWVWLPLLGAGLMHLWDLALRWYVARWARERD